MTDDKDTAALTDEQRELFSRRIAELDANPDVVFTWDQIKDRIKTRQTDTPHSEAGGPP